MFYCELADTFLCSFPMKTDVFFESDVVIPSRKLRETFVCETPISSRPPVLTSPPLSLVAPPSFSTLTDPTDARLL